MSLSIARARCSLHLPCLSSNILARRAMMSALRNGPSPNPHQTPAMPDSPPVTIPAERMLSPDAAAPQTAAPPPPAPRVEKPRPKIRSTKAALTIVRDIFHTIRRNLLTNSLRFVDTSCCISPSKFIKWPDTAAYSHRCAEQGLCRSIVSSRLCRQAWQI